MEIEFINKMGASLIEDDVSNLLGVKINTIMPSVVSEFHSRFIDTFIKKGKSYMINNTRQLFVKQRSGFICPVYSYLLVNYLNIK